MPLNGGERGGGGLELVGESMLPEGGIRSDKSSLESQDEEGQDADVRGREEIYGF